MSESKFVGKVLQITVWLLNNFVPAMLSILGEPNLNQVIPRNVFISLFIYLPIYICNSKYSTLNIVNDYITHLSILFSMDLIFILNSIVCTYLICRWQRETLNKEIISKVCFSYLCFIVYISLYIFQLWYIAYSKWLYKTSIYFIEVCI